MSKRPIFCVTHPRSCSTAFERAFMTRSDLQCLHEPFGDAFYFGPERFSPRFENDGKSTYKFIMEEVESHMLEGKRFFIKDMAYHLMPPGGISAGLAHTLVNQKRGVGTPQDGNLAAAEIETMTKEKGNPTMIPNDMLAKFHFTFLIRHPRYAIPSFYRCSCPPLVEKTRFWDFDPSEVGYKELRILFDYLLASGQTIRQRMDLNGINSVEAAPKGSQPVEVCVIDAEDLLNKPAQVLEAYCQAVGLEYSPDMLSWDSGADKKKASELFEHWAGWHDDAIKSTGLQPRATPRVVKSEEEEDAEWRAKYGEDAASVIRKTVNANTSDYQYLKQFALKVE